MGEWPYVLGPAVVLALVVRIDARIIGPYFALSSLVAAVGGVNDRYWYGDKQLRQAVTRRLLYPAVLGFGLAWTRMSTGDIVAVGAIAGGLLLWPVIFHGLPWFVPRRTWHLPVLYVSFLVAYPMLSWSGAIAQEILIYLSDGDVGKWVANQFFGSVSIWVLALFATAIFRKSLAKTEDEASRRERAGSSEEVND